MVIHIRHYECLRLLAHLHRRARGVRLLELVHAGETLIFKFKLRHIRCTPCHRLWGAMKFFGNRWGSPPLYDSYLSFQGTSKRRSKRSTVTVTRRA